MYWKSRSTNVYIKGGIYSHSDGEAPVATVRFGSTRGVPSSIVRPKLENIIPYMDDRKGVYFHNTSKIDKPLEWCEHASVSGSHIENVNNEILRIGRDGAFMAWLRSDDKYGKFAFDILDTYLNGIYYRNPVVDLNNGHAQTLAGITTFEVIQEHIIPELACYYDFLYGYIDENYPEKKDVFEASLKKMIDQTIKNGVPHNNWNLHQAKIILPVAMVLEDDSCYSDGKGRQYYIDYILNRSTSRQWSLKRFLEYGYDFNNAIWNECPGYAQGVIRDLTNFVIDYDNTFNQNLLPYYPVMEKAVEVLPQYMFPNRLITAFGDTYYGEINYDAILNIIRLAQKYNNYEMEEKFISMYKIFNNTNSETDSENIKVASQVNNLFNRKPLNIDNNVVIGDIRDYISQTFYAPNVSWFVQRNKFEDEHNGMREEHVVMIRKCHRHFGDR